MKEKYLNSFLVTAKMIWEEVVGHNLEFDKAEVVSNQFTTDDITVVIGISGSLEGNVLYGFHEETARAVVGVMLAEPGVTVDHELGRSAIAEIANMITGHAATRLSQIGYPCNITPPVIIGGSGTSLTILVGPQILVTFASSLGGLKVRISLSETSRTDETQILLDPLEQKNITSYR